MLTFDHCKNVNHTVHEKYTWLYRGKKKYYAMCPQCRTQVNIRKHSVQVQEQEEYLEKYMQGICKIMGIRRQDLDEKAKEKITKTIDKIYKNGYRDGDMLPYKR